MGRYETFLTELLEPLGIYDLTEGTAAESELYALGTVLDQLDLRLAEMEREMSPVTAEAEGLRNWETLFAKKNTAQTVSQRRETILSLLQVGVGDLTAEAVERTLQGCGIRAVAEETGSDRIQVRFPGTVGVPEEFEEIQNVILNILPCHLEVEFVFRYMSWDECELQRMSWDGIEAAEHTWHSFENAVPQR